MEKEDWKTESKRKRNLYKKYFEFMLILEQLCIDREEET